ncbi:MAG: M56 family metallopeptidase [Lachnospiraceae bacterium]|nr:M56 family metallopeptidase [Lachnospiraceae bacterium]
MGMLSLFLKVLNLSLVGSYIILIVLLARLLLQKSPKWCSYLLWGVVFLRLVLPVFPESEYSLIPEGLEISDYVIEDLQGKISSQQDVPTEGMQADDKQAYDIPTNSIQGETGQSGNMSANSMQEENGQSGDNADETVGNMNNAGKLSVIFRIFSYIWLVGMIALGAYHIWSYNRFRKQVRGAVLAEDGVYEIQGTHIPFVMGIWKPTIYLSGELDEESRKVVLCHEQVHLKRRDYLIKPLALAVCCVHWFNPLVWLAFYLMGRDCEMSCDEKVVSILGEDSKKIYSFALLDEATGGKRAKSKRENMCAVLSFGEESIKSRIKHVLNYKRASVWLSGGTVLVLAVLIVCLCSNSKTENAENYENLIAMQVIATDFVKEADGWYLSFQVQEGSDKQRGTQVTAKVEDSELLEVLSDTSLSDVNGVQLKLTMPEKMFKESGAYTETTQYGMYREHVDLWVLVCDSDYQTYFTVSEIYFKDGPASGKGTSNRDYGIYRSNKDSLVNRYSENMRVCGGKSKSRL